MKKFQRVPAIVEAEQWWPWVEIEGVKTRTLSGDPNTIGGAIVQSYIATLEGPMTVDPGDWVVKGIAGELFPVKPDIFAKNYTAVNE